MQKQTFVVSMIVLLQTAAAAVAHAADAYPVRPIRFIVPFPPGGGADTLARTVGQKIGEAWGQQVVIDNRPGGATNIAAEVAAHAAPDGYTLLETVLAHAVNMSLYPKLGYDLQRDFAPVVFMATIPNLLVVNPSVPVKSTRELIDHARTRPGQLNFYFPDYAVSRSGSVGLMNAARKNSPPFPRDTRMNHFSEKSHAPAVICQHPYDCRDARTAACGNGANLGAAHPRRTQAGNAAPRRP